MSTIPGCGRCDTQVNRGYGAALRTGFGAAQYELIFYTDSDNQFDIGELAHALPMMADYDVLVGFRVYRYDSPIRVMVSWGYNLLVRILFRVRGARRRLRFQGVPPRGAGKDRDRDGQLLRRHRAGGEGPKVEFPGGGEGRPVITRESRARRRSSRATFPEPSRLCSRCGSASISRLGGRSVPPPRRVPPRQRPTSSGCPGRRPSTATAQPLDRGVRPPSAASMRRPCSVTTRARSSSASITAASTGRPRARCTDA